MSIHRRHRSRCFYSPSKRGGEQKGRRVAESVRRCTDCSILESEAGRGGKTVGWTDDGSIGLGDRFGWRRGVERGGKERADSRESVERVNRRARRRLRKGWRQAVAIRPDLLPPAYLEEFQTLLDQVEAFPSEDARRLIQKTIGENVRLEDVFEDVVLRRTHRCGEYRAGVQSDSEERCFEKIGRGSG